MQTKWTRFFRDWLPADPREMFSASCARSFATGLESCTADERFIGRFRRKYGDVCKLGLERGRAEELGDGVCNLFDI